MATIDWSAPIALDNGREARVKFVRSDGSAEVEIKGGYSPHFDRVYLINEWYAWNYDADGSWSNGSSKYYKIVNVDDSASFIPEDWS